MHQQYSQSVNEETEEDGMNESFEVRDVQGSSAIDESPSILNIKKPSHVRIKNKSVSRKNSRLEFIKVSKCQKSSLLNGYQNQSQKKSRVKVIKKQCRICLEDESEGRIVRPCKCTGSMQYVHEKCLVEWINRKINFKTRIKVQCQVCQSPFNYKITKRLFISCQVLKQNYEKHRSNYIGFFIVMAILILLWLALFIVTLIGFSPSQNNWVRKNILEAQHIRIIFICVVLVFFLIIMFITLLFIAEYGVKTQYTVKNLQNYIKGKRKIIPKLYTIAT